MTISHKNYVYILSNPNNDIKSEQILTDQKRHSMVSFIVIATLLFLSGCINTKANQSDNVASERELNKEIVTRYMNARWTPDYQAVRAQTHSSDYKEIRNEFENLSYNSNNSELADVAMPMRLAFPDRNEEVEVILGEGNIVAVKYKFTGTHQANFFGIPATGKAIEVDSVAIFRLVQNKITEGWFMADEVALLRQLDIQMPVRADGKTIIPPTIALTSDLNENLQSGDALLKNLLDHPVDSRDYRNKLKVAARRAKNPPPGIIPAEGRPYGKILRYGFAHFVDVGTMRGKLPNRFGEGIPDRVNLIPHLILDGDWGMINFRVTGTNTGDFYDLPASNNAVDAWEVSFMQFDNEEWATAWFFGDDMGLLQQIGASQEFFFPDGLEYKNLNNPNY